MDLTPETLRSATFRDKLRGYHPDDVDEFLESVARGLEVLLARLRDASEKARAAAQPEAPAPQADEAVRTLSLAQRTADLAIHEAKAEAERLLKAAENRARRVVGEAEEEAVRLAEEAQAELRSDLEKLQAARDQLFSEVNTLRSWLQGERGRIRRALVEVADRVENVRDPDEHPPVRKPVTPKPPRQKLEAKQARPAAAEPPVERPRAAAPPREVREVTPPRGNPPLPPPAAPAPRQPTPPGGQPAVTRLEAPKPPPEPPQVAEPSDAAVLQRAQGAIVSDQRFDDDDDPFFAELRQAMTDDTPLGPRDDE